jgi:hypothetical protein
MSDSIHDVIDEIDRTEGAKIVHMEPNLIIAWIYKYAASKKLGSSSWCISYSDSYFNSYVTNELNKQYFVWDFNYAQAELKHRIGITVLDSGKIKTAHDKADGYCVSYVNGTDWKKYLTALTPKDAKEWLTTIDLSSSNMNEKQIGVFLKSLIADSDFKTFKEILDKQANTQQSKEKYAKSLDVPALREAYNNGDLDIFKYIVDELGLSLFRTMGAPFMMVMDGDKPEFLEYMKTKIEVKDLHSLKASLTELVNSTKGDGGSKDLVANSGKLINYIDKFLEMVGEK